MLVLSRRKEEEIVIGSGVVVKVKILEICGDKVKIGLTAPEAVTIMRGELVAAKVDKKENNGLERPAD